MFKILRKLAKSITFLICIPEITHTNIEQDIDTDNPWVFSGLSQSLQAISGKVY
jgi:hypothetical protein